MAPQVAWIGIGNMGRVSSPILLPLSLAGLQPVGHVQEPRGKG